MTAAAPNVPRLRCAGEDYSHEPAFLTICTANPLVMQCPICEAIECIENCRLATDGGEVVVRDETVDRPRLHVGDHVRDRENPSERLLVVDRTGQQANEYQIAETTTTIADVHPEYDPTDEILEVAYPQRGAIDVTDLMTVPIPRGRLELLAPIRDRDHGGDT